MISIPRFFGGVLLAAVVAALSFTAPAFAAVPVLQVNGRGDTAQVKAPMPAQISWDASDVDRANGVFLFVGPDRNALQLKQGACATQGPEVFTNASGGPGTGFHDKKKGSLRQSLGKGTHYVLACAARQRDDGKLSNQNAPSNIVKVEVTDSRPSVGGGGTAVDPQRALPDLIPVAAVTHARRVKEDKSDFHIAGYGVDVPWPGSFDPSGGTFLCEKASVLVYNGGAAKSGPTDVRIRVELVGQSARARAVTGRVSSLEPGQCQEITLDLGTPVACSSVSAQVDVKGTVNELSEANNKIPPVPAAKPPCKLKLPRTTVDHRGGQNKKTVDHR